MEPMETCVFRRKMRLNLTGFPNTIVFRWFRSNRRVGLPLSPIPDCLTCGCAVFLSDEPTLSVVSSRNLRIAKQLSIRKSTWTQISGLALFRNSNRRTCCEDLLFLGTKSLPVARKVNLTSYWLNDTSPDIFTQQN